MKLSRELALKIHFVLDQCLPPVIRDSRLFMSLPFRLLYKSKAPIFMNFKERALSMSEEEFSEAYLEIQSVTMERETDLNAACLEAIVANVRGRTVLDAGCGRGVLAGRLAASHQVTAVDMVLEPGLGQKYPAVSFRQGNLEHLPFGDASFDTVICTNTLEHVQNMALALAELRRVTKQLLIIVVPRQRAYRYTFDLHLQFFPYAHSLLAVLAPGSRPHKLDNVGGDWFYQEESNGRPSGLA